MDGVWVGSQGACGWDLIEGRPQQGPAGVLWGPTGSHGAASAAIIGNVEGEVEAR